MNRRVELVAGWLKKAGNDLLNARNNLGARKVPYDTVCFHCQQAAEKSLKAFLTFHNIAFTKTHNLLQLLELGKRAAKDMEMLRPALTVLNDYAVLVRYPDEWFEPERKDAKEAFEFAKQIRDWAVGKIGKQCLP